MLKKIALSVTLATSVWAYHSAELNINNKDLAAKLDMDIGQFNENVDPDTTFIGLDYLSSDREDSAPEFDDTIAMVGAHFFKQHTLEALPDLKIGLGLKINGTTIKSGIGSNDNNLFVTVPVGIELEYHLPIDAVALYVGAQAYYAPEVLSYYEATNYKEYNGYLSMELIPTVEVKAGYRSIDLNYSHNINKSAYAGLKFSF